MKRILVIALLISAVIQLTACQPTPEKPIVQSKNDGKLEQEIQSTNESHEKYTAPEHWKDSVPEKGNLTIEFDANVIIPNVTDYPVAHIGKEAITEEWCESFLKKLSNDGKICSYKNESILTKPEVFQIIKELMDELEDPNSNVNDKSLSEKRRAELRAEREKDIAAWQEYLKTAPNKFVVEEIPVEFVETNNGECRYFDCGINMGYKNMTEVLITPWSEVGGEVLINISDGEDSGEIVSYTDDIENRNDLKLNPEEAVEMGKEFIKRMTDGEFDASLIRCGYMRLGESQKDVTKYPECYEINFTRSVKGVPTTYRNDNMESIYITDSMQDKILAQSQYAQHIPQEYIKMIIVDSGITAVIWHMPSVLQDTVNANVKLIPFDEITEICKKQISIEGLLGENIEAGFVSKKIVITRAVLGMSQMREKNSYDRLIMVPTWSFYGYEVLKYDKQQPGGYILNEQNEYVNDQLGDHSFLIINAIDGSIINPIFGY